jgi:S1-C subfamily serine protease
MEEQHRGPVFAMDPLASPPVSRRPGAFRALLLLLLLLLAALGVASGPRPAEPALSGTEVYRRALAAVAWVHATDQGKGTGWIVDLSRRWLITNYHVVGENQTAEVIFPARQQGRVIALRAWYFEHLPELREQGLALRGRVIARNADTDLALIELDRLPPGVAALPVAAGPPAPGTPVHGLGNRYDTDSLWLHLTGSVRQARTLREGYFTGGKQVAKGARVVEVLAPINEGDSGGPLLDERGRVVGVAAAVAWESQGAGLFIDVREVAALLAKAGGSPSPEGPLPAGEAAPAAVYRLGLRSLVLVRPAEAVRGAAGFVVDRRRRLILTTAEVAARNKTLDVIFPATRDGRLVADGAWYRRELRTLRERGLAATGCVLAADSRRNLALVEVEALPDDTREPEWAEAEPEPGMRVHGLGHSGRFEVLWMYTAGSVRQAGHATLGPSSEEPPVSVLIVQMPVGEGEAGGPLLDDRGRLVGVMTGKAGPQQLVGYALPVRELRAFLDGARAAWSPRSAAEWTVRGRLLLAARQYDPALAAFDAALEIDPRSATACSERARAHAERGDASRALEDAERAVRLDPRLPAGWCRRAAARIGTGQLKPAVADCDTALGLDRQCAEAWRLRARANRLLGELERALPDADEAVWLDRASPLGYLERGLIHARKDDSDRALADLNQAVQLDPLLAEGFLARADCFWARSDVQAALADYEQALSLTPAEARAWLGRGRLE